VSKSAIFRLSPRLAITVNQTLNIYLNMTTQHDNTTQAALAFIAASPATSAWKRGVKVYALEMVESLADQLDPTYSPEKLLNGARNWSEYSYGGSALMYDSDIAERLCSPSELKRTKNGDNQPSKAETWIDVQTRALRQAARLIDSAYSRAERQAPAPATERPGDHAAALAEDWGCSYSDALVYCNCD
jgi:hypothetical protein